MSTPAASSKTKAEIAKLTAEADSLAAEARKLNAEALQAEYDALKAKVSLDRLNEERELELVSDVHNRVYRFATEVSHSSVAMCMKVLEGWSRLDKAHKKKPQPIEIVFTSPGGNVLHGMALFDSLRMLSRRGHHIITTDLGYSASMAGILLQAGDTRRMGKESYFHIHEISAGAVGKITEMEDEVEFCKKMMERVVAIFVERSDGKLTPRKLKSLYERREAWFDSEEALKYGLVDEIV